MGIIITNVHLSEDEAYKSEAIRIFEEIKSRITKDIKDFKGSIIFELTVPHRFFTIKVNPEDNKVISYINTLPLELQNWIV